MYQYKCVEVFSEIIGFSKSQSNYHKIIDEYAKMGWRFVQLLPISYNMDGRPLKFEVIFEKEIEK
jgi:hypothetical protein